MSSLYTLGIINTIGNVFVFFVHQFFLLFNNLFLVTGGAQRKKNNESNDGNGKGYNTYKECE